MPSFLEDGLIIRVAIIKIFSLVQQKQFLLNRFYLIAINYRDFVETELIEKRSELCLNNDSVKEKTDISNDRIDFSDALFIK